MALEVGAILEGTVTGIAKYGAFISLPEGKSGLVHISELANSYVNDVNEHVQLGQRVNVQVLRIGADGKINLSIKRTMPTENNDRNQTSSPRNHPVREQKEIPSPGKSLSAEEAFEDKLKKFMREADSRIADNRFYSERRQRNSRR